MNSILRFIAIAAVIAPTGALATTWTCTNNNLVRTVSIESEAGSTACNVNYTKESEGVGMKTLWTAANDPTYCTEKAESFVGKLTSWGWTCTKAGETAEPMAETAPAEAAPAEAAPAEAAPATPAAPAVQ